MIASQVHNNRILAGGYEDRTATLTRLGASLFLEVPMGEGCYGKSQLPSELRTKPIMNSVGALQYPPIIAQRCGSALVRVCLYK
jgi:hypothetical protein